MASFLLASELKIRTKAASEGASLATETLKELTEKRHRFQVLPSAISLYIADGNAVGARECLDEYIETMYRDKKAHDKNIRFVLVKDIGTVEIVDRVAEADIQKVLTA